MGELNNALEAGNDNCMFVTLFLGVLDLDSLQLALCQRRSHPTQPAARWRCYRSAAGRRCRPGPGQGPGLTYPDNTLQLQPGDRLAIYTDGIDEAFNEQAQMFGFERFNNCLRRQGKAGPIAAAGPGRFRRDR